MGTAVPRRPAWGRVVGGTGRPPYIGKARGVRPYAAAEENQVMVRQKLHETDRLFVQVVLLTLGVAALPVTMLAILWIGSKITGGA